MIIINLGALPSAEQLALRPLFEPFGLYDTVDWLLDRACWMEKQGRMRAAEANLASALWREEVEQRVGMHVIRS